MAAMIKKAMNRTRKLALVAILSALGVVFLYLGSVIEVLDLSTAALASLITVFAVIELGKGYPWGIYLVTSVLSLLLLPNKFGALVFLVFAGYYPMAKARFERMHYIVSWVLKFSVFNTALLGLLLGAKYLLLLPEEELALTPVLVIVANVAFLLYDIAMTKLITLYLIRGRKRLGLKNYFDN